MSLTDSTRQEKRTVREGRTREERKAREVDVWLLDLPTGQTLEFDHEPVSSEIFDALASDDILDALAEAGRELNGLMIALQAAVDAGHMLPSRRTALLAKFYGRKIREAASYLASTGGRA